MEHSTSIKAALRVICSVIMSVGYYKTILAGLLVFIWAI